MRVRPLTGAVVAAFSLLVALLAWPEVVLAQGPSLPGIPLPKPSLPDLTPDVGGWAVDGFKSIIEWAFGDVKGMARSLVRILLGVPLITDTSEFPGLNKFREYVQAGAWAILVLSFVVASMKAWAAGFTGSGAWEGFDGIRRTVLAIGMLLVFVPAFDVVSRAINELTQALVVNPIVGDGLSASGGPFAAFVAVGSLVSSGGLAMIVGIGVIVMMLILLLVKIIVTALLAVLFVGSPLAIALWPIEEVAFLLRSMMQAIFGVLLFPVLWALCFAVFAVLSPDALFSSGGSWLNTVLGPLVALASLVIAFKLPFVVLRQSMNAGLMPSPLRAVRTYTAVSRLRTPVTGRP